MCSSHIGPTTYKQPPQLTSKKLHLFLELAILILAIKSTDIYPELKDIILSFFAEFKLLKFVSPQYCMLAIAIYYIFSTLLHPMLGLDKESMSNLKKYNSNRNETWKKYRDVLKLKAKVDDANESIIKLKKEIGEFLKNKNSD